MSGKPPARVWRELPEEERPGRVLVAFFAFVCVALGVALWLWPYERQVGVSDGLIEAIAMENNGKRLPSAVLTVRLADGRKVLVRPRGQWPFRPGQVVRVGIYRRGAKGPYHYRLAKEEP